MRKHLVLSTMLVLLLFVLSAGQVVAGNNSCDPQVNAFVLALSEDTCRYIEPNQACYGVETVTTKLPPNKWRVGASSPIGTLGKLQTNDQGIALLHILTNFNPTNPELLKVAIFGRMSLNDLGGNSYLLRTQGGKLLCEKSSGGMLLQTSEKKSTSIVINGATIRLKSTAFISMDSVVLFDGDPRIGKKVDGPNPDAPFCSGFASDCNFGDGGCPEGYRLVWGPYGRPSDYPYVEDGLYRVTLYGQGTVQMGATDWGATGQTFSFGSTRVNLATPQSYTFCWQGNRPGSIGFETIALARSPNARIDWQTIEYLGPSCANARSAPTNGDFMAVTNLQGEVYVTIPGFQEVPIPEGQHVRIRLVGNQPVAITGPFEAVGLGDSYLLNFLADENQGGLAFASRTLPNVEVLYDFMTEAPNAQWYSSAASLTWSNTDNFDQGFVRWQDGATLQDGSQRDRVLETHPSSELGGWIAGRFQTDNIDLQPGDYFVADVGLMSGAEYGDVDFAVEFEPALGFGPRVQPLASAEQTLPIFWKPIDPPIQILSYEIGRIRNVTYYAGPQRFEINLQRIMGLDPVARGSFVLRVYANSSSYLNPAVWIDPHIERRSP